MVEPGTYTKYPALKPLPALVRKQRRLEAKIAPLAPLVDDEKAVRKEIDELLIACKFGRGEGVTCHGYDVTHNDRKGATSFDAENMVSLLVRCGVDPEFVDFLVQDSTTTAPSPQWATVKPSKGAKVRT